jgi:Ca2+-binding EF-hand superfamily protein
LVIKEFTSALKACGNYTDEELAAMFQSVNVNQNGVIMYVSAENNWNVK